MLAAAWGWPNACECLAAQAIYSQDIGHSFLHKGAFELSSIYPRAYRGVAGASVAPVALRTLDCPGRR